MMTGVNRERAASQVPSPGFLSVALLPPPAYSKDRGRLARACRLRRSGRPPAQLTGRGRGLGDRQSRTYRRRAAVACSGRRLSVRDYQPLGDGHEPADFDEYFDVPAQADDDFAARV
jgi:hypothetical protein